MNDVVEALLRNHDLCVLCTCGAGGPLASLMSYCVEDDLAMLYVATRADSRKYKNVEHNPKVSVLIDNRDTVGDAAQRCALTLAGRAEAVADLDRRAVLGAHLLARHPQLEGIVQASDGVILAIRIDSYLLVRGPDKALFIPRAPL
ncbi:MAG: pyridoxamine 5'-phosphate oxidase family protein [Desulfovibrionaceae bacterium]